MEYRHRSCLGALGRTIRRLKVELEMRTLRQLVRDALLVLLNVAKLKLGDD
jgi:hypothetical protein